MDRRGHRDRRHRAARSRSRLRSSSSRSGRATRRRWPRSAARAGVPIIADESLYTLADARQLARAGACDVFSIYIGKSGGIGPARAIADFALGQGIACTLGSNLELGVGSAAMIHLAVAHRGITPDDYPCDIIGPLFYEDDILTSRFRSAAAARSRRPAGAWRGARSSEGREVPRPLRLVSRSIRNTCGPSHRTFRHASRNSTQSYFQSPATRANSEQ